MLAAEQLALFSLPAPESGGSWSVYLILCDNQSLYCGISNRPEARFAAHLSGKGARYTRIRKPLSMRLVYHELSREHALRAEIRIKQLTAAQKQQLWQLLPNFQTA
ncbi:MAG: GIY-YIG nuclease family protein [Neisseria zoodegmatis]|uniref:GIY-YIG nuclease family protein n=1 Tax=Neisseria zoodegmatis TaxID=326523 RepID=UPI0026EF2ED2|nr:GIY-YIG nuclease family protein [Neisseria zoodegmatis]MDO5070305.1 GIY-YIG nuclease family protein [Neisseria zoodegmatis]